MIWNPIEGIDLGFFMIRFYSLTWAVAFALGWYIMKYVFIRENESIEKLDKLFVYTLLATMFGARIGHVLFYQQELIFQDPLSVILPFSFKDGIKFTGFSGLASHGATIGIIIAMYFVKTKVLKRPFLWILDRVALTIPSGAVLIRLGNFFNSEIVGKVTSKDSFMAMKFIRDSESLDPNVAMKSTGAENLNEAYNSIAGNPMFKSVLDSVPFRYPAQLFEALAYIPLCLLLLYLYWKTDARNKPGLLLGVFLVVLWGVRFFVEYVKESQGGFEQYPIFNDLSTGQWLSIPFFCIGLILIFRSFKSNNENIRTV